MSEPVELKPGMIIRIRMADTSDEWCVATVYMMSTGEDMPSNEPKFRSIGLILSGLVRTRNMGFIGGALPLFYFPDAGKYVGLDYTDYEIKINI